MNGSAIQNTRYSQQRSVYGNGQPSINNRRMDSHKAGQQYYNNQPYIYNGQATADVLPDPELKPIITNDPFSVHRRRMSSVSGLSGTYRYNRMYNYQNVYDVTCNANGMQRSLPLRKEQTIMLSDPNPSDTHKGSSNELLFQYVSLN